MNFSETRLWRTSLGSTTTDQIALTRLVGSLDQIRARAGLLTTRISSALPGLTIHDITHLDALWEIADVIAGTDFPLNPLEAYIFGGAVLLHDASLCFEAYTDGRAGVRRTTEWKDAHARISASRPGSSAEAEADFEALRSLHANNAAKLACDPWRDPSGEDVYLIEDSELREHYGRLIGRIAASHHWDLELLDTTFSSPIPPTAFLPREWFVDSLKIACLLRCADAGHIDGARAPGFLLKILRMNTLSRQHWVAQNHLGRLIIDPDDSARLVIASTQPFSEREAPAWWVSFDLIELLDRELRGSNRLLGQRGTDASPRFARTSVAGAGSVADLKNYVTTDGWEPTNTTIHVSDVAALIQKLGGEQLYGGPDEDKLAVVIRELVQNASDAIGARCAVEGHGSRGKITVRLREGRDRDTVVLEVEDDGIGMSTSTLTGDLMDFGKSFWPSARAAQEFPGLQSSGYTARGQFGIGFFSVFMIAASARVITRRFDRGLDSAQCLSFPSGLSLRPTLSQFREDNFGMNCSTRVELTIDREVLRNPDRIRIGIHVQRPDKLAVSFSEYVGAVVSGIRESVFVEWNSQQECVHGGFPPNECERRAWLEQLAYVRSGTNSDARVAIHDHVGRLREIRDGDRCYGLAAINTGRRPNYGFVSAKAVTGLVSPHDRLDEPFVGLIDHIPANAKRDPGAILAPPEVMRSWLREQAELVVAENGDPLKRLAASAALCEFGWDPLDVLSHVLLQADEKQRYVKVAQLLSLLRSGRRLGFRVSSTYEYLELYGKVTDIPGVDTYIPIGLGRFNRTQVVDGVPKDEYSAIGTIHRILVANGGKPKWRTTRSAYPGTYADGDLLEVVA